MTFTTETASFLWIGDIGIAADAVESFEPFNPSGVHPPSIKISLRSGREHFVLFDDKESRNAAIHKIREILRS